MNLLPHWSSVTVEQEAQGSIPGSGKVLLGYSVRKFPSERRACMIRCMNVEARGACKDRSRWRSVVSYPYGKKA